MKLRLCAIACLLISLNIACKKSSTIDDGGASLLSLHPGEPLTLAHQEKVLNPVFGILTDDQRFESTDVVEIHSGILLAVLSNTYENAEKSTIYKSYSYDHGVTWTSPQNINLPFSSYRFTACNLFKVKSRIFLVMNRVAAVPGTKEGGIPAICYSDDNGYTWTKPHKMLNGGEKEIVLMNSRNVTRTKTGRVIIPIGSGQFGKNAHQISLIYSDNNGKTWLESQNCFGGINTRQARFSEPSIGQLNDGRLIMLIRTTLGNIYKSYSGDNGITWEKPTKTSLVSPWTAHTIRITKQGYILVAYTHALSKGDPGYPRNNLKFAISYDNGETFVPSGTILEIPISKTAFLMEPNITYTSADQYLVTYYRLLDGKNHRIETALFDRPNVLKDEEHWNNLQRWWTSGGGTTATIGSQLHLGEYTNTITSVTKRQVIPNSYVVEFRSKINQFVKPGNIDLYTSLGLKIESNNYRLMFKIEADGYYVIDDSGSWVRYSTPDYLSHTKDWHVWRIEVFNGKATVYMDDVKVIEKYNLPQSESTGLISHWTSSNYDMKTDCYIDYTHFDPL